MVVFDGIVLVLWTARYGTKSTIRLLKIVLENKASRTITAVRKQYNTGS